MIVLLSDSRLAVIPIRDNGETLVDVGASAPLWVAEPTYLRHGLVDRLVTAQSLLPRDVRLLIVNGYRPPALPCQHLTCALEEANLTRPDASSDDLVGVCVTPPEVAPHPTGGAVDLILSDEDTPTRGPLLLPACCAGEIPPPPEKTEQMLAGVLEAVGLVTYLDRWWHWSYGDRFWAWTTRAPHARYGPLPAQPDE